MTSIGTKLPHVRADKPADGTPGGIAVEAFRGTKLDVPLFNGWDSTLHHPSVRVLAEQQVPADDFSARWSGFLYFDSARISHLCGIFDDGMRLYLNNDLLIDDWYGGGSRRKCGKVRVEEGWYPLRVEYFESVGLATIQISEGVSRINTQAIAPARLCCRKR